MRAQSGLEGGAVGVAPHALAVHRAGAGQHEVGGHVAGAGEGVEQLGGADDVDHAVAGALRERLRGAGLGREVDDGVGPEVGDDCVEVVGAGDVADAEVDRRPAGPPAAAEPGCTCGCRLSRTTHCSAESASSRASVVPMKPAPPVTRTRPPACCEDMGTTLCDGQRDADVAARGGGLAQWPRRRQPVRPGQVWNTSSLWTTPGRARRGQDPRAGNRPTADQLVDDYYRRNSNRARSGWLGGAASVMHQRLERNRSRRSFPLTVEVGAGRFEHYPFVTHARDRYLATDIRVPTDNAVYGRSSSARVLKTSSSGSRTPWLSTSTTAQWAAWSRRAC